MHFQLPAPGRLSAERDCKALQAITAGDEHGRLLPRAVLRQACVPVLGQHPVVVNGQDFVVHIEAVLPSRCLTLHLGDEQTTVVYTCHQTEPGFLWGCGRGGFEAQSEPVESLGVVEFLSGFQDTDKPGAQVNTGDLLCQGTKFFAGKTMISGVALVGQE